MSRSGPRTVRDFGPRVTFAKRGKGSTGGLAFVRGLADRLTMFLRVAKNCWDVDGINVPVIEKRVWKPRTR
jgi:hypothetical protein